jgi:hypothetical protein
MGARFIVVEDPATGPVVAKWGSSAISSGAPSLDSPSDNLPLTVLICQVYSISRDDNILRMWYIFRLPRTQDVFLFSKRALEQ